ncbi:hypothetical protein [Actinomadura madurae]|uniref:hypothetical protein n=1 Tax=Actinomadura madurae TaxID=1993 RepID=UPI001FD4EB3C|nr:hypothetical protein [Actinomadura madurae]
MVEVEQIAEDLVLAVLVLQLAQLGEHARGLRLDPRRRARAGRHGGRPGALARAEAVGELAQEPVQRRVRGRRDLGQHGRGRGAVAADPLDQEGQRRVGQPRDLLLQGGQLGPGLGGAALAGRDAVGHHVHQAAQHVVPLRPGERLVRSRPVVETSDQRGQRPVEQFLEPALQPVALAFHPGQPVTEAPRALGEVGRRADRQADGQRRHAAPTATSARDRPSTASSAPSQAPTTTIAANVQIQNARSSAARSRRARPAGVAIHRVPVSGGGGRGASSTRRSAAITDLKA